MSEIKKSICRFCHAACPINVEIDNGKAVKIVGDKDNTVYHGFTCIKGRSLPDQHSPENRLLHSMKRMPDGTHQPIPATQAMDEIAAKTQHILERHGPRSIALYLGTCGFLNPTSAPIAGAWMGAIQSPMFFTTTTIDQPGKPMAQALHGRWQAGYHWFDDSDAWILVGVNPLVAMSNGIPNSNPARRLHQAKKRGHKLIVIDPRKTESAEAAHVHLQPKPGEDPTIIAGMIRWIIHEELQDSTFLQRHVNGFEPLARAVEPFTPEYVERRADVPAALLIEAARTFATAKRAGASAGTGANMAPRGMLTEYLLQSLQTICGQWPKENETIPNPFVLLPPYRFRAQAVAPRPAWGFGEQLRVRGLRDTISGLSTAALADEILLEGEGQVKALFNLGGNPVSAWPDQLKTLDAMKALELNVSLDPKMSETAKLSDYVIAPKLSLELPGSTLYNESLWFYGAGLGYPKPYAQYTPRLLDPPQGSDLIEEWEFFYGLAQRMGLPLTLYVVNSWEPGSPPRHTVELNMENPPTAEELLEHLTHGSCVPLAEVKKFAEGRLYGNETVRVEAADPNDNARLDVGNDDMLSELENVSREPFPRNEKFPFMLISRRLASVYNSSGIGLPKLQRRSPYNAAYMHPNDLERLSLNSGDMIEITSDNASIPGIVEAAEDIRPGVISMAHCFGGTPEDDNDAQSMGSNTGRLVSVDRDYDPRSGLPRMSAIPVAVRPLKQSDIHAAS